MTRTLLALFVVTCFIGCRQKTPAEIETENAAKLASDYKKGKMTFLVYCTNCHFEPGQRISDPPVFTNLFERPPYTDEQVFIKYIQNSKALRQAGNQYFIDLARTFHSDYEHQFKDSIPLHAFPLLITYLKKAGRPISKQ